tara:strand:+ start:824 stop:1087 length:264 start_codon:yes stop_codon:yes gene_type:complete
MTPKEKAEELVDKMYFSRRYKENENYIPQQAFIHAKKCALIAVDEIMKAPHENSYLELIPSDADDTDWFWDKYDEYWEEVKNEIEKL